MDFGPQLRPCPVAYLPRYASPVILSGGQYPGSGVSAQADSIRATLRRFDETTLAAAYSIRDAEIRLVEGALTQEEADAIWDAAWALNPYAPGIIMMLSNLDGLPAQIQTALPELVNDTNIARITAALRLIDDELKSYFTDADTVHLANALDTGLQNLHQALRRSFGYWQKGQDPETVTADLDLRSERRDELTGKLMAALRHWIPGSDAQLRGSLDSGSADGYSDVNLCWVVPDEEFIEAADTLGAALSQVTAVLSLRADPRFARSARRRLVCARLYGLPLFWPIHIDIRATSAADDDLYDSGNPAARSDAGWSGPASAIENAIVALKAAARSQAGTADGLLRRGWERIGHQPGPTADLAGAIIGLADACAAEEPNLATMAAEIHQAAERLVRAPASGEVPG